MTEKLWDLLVPVVESEGVDLVEIEYKKEGKNWFLRVFVDKEGGVTVDDCSLVSRQISLILDVEETIPHHFTLEVSSPGLSRPLKKLSDYRRFKGKLIQVKTYAPLGGRKKHIGRIVDVEGENILLDIKAEKKRLVITLQEISRCTLELEF